jgi:hypothetical protein
MGNLELNKKGDYVKEKMYIKGGGVRNNYSLNEFVPE